MIGGTWLTTVPDRKTTTALPQLAAAMVVLPVFLQAPWVRIHPFSAAVFTAVLIVAGVLLHRSNCERRAEIGSLLVGFSGSWLAGCVFWGWMRAHPLLHLPIEAFALPLALTGLNSKWRLAAAFYLASLAGTACTDLTMALTGVMPFWPAVVNAPLGEASHLLHEAASQLMKPQQLLILVAASGSLLSASRWLKELDLNSATASQTYAMTASVLTTTLFIDSLFLLAALLQPGLSGLI